MAIKATGPQPPKSIYEKEVYEPYIEPIAKDLQTFLENSTKSIKEGYDKTTSEAGKTIDDGVNSLREMLGQKPEKVKTSRDSTVIRDEPRDRHNYMSESGKLRVIEFSPDKDKTLSAIIEKGQQRPIDTSTTATKTTVRPDEIIDIDELADMSEEEIATRIAPLNLDAKIKEELKKIFIKKRAKMRSLKGKQIQDRGFLQYMVDEFKKNSEGK